MKSLFPVTMARLDGGTVRVSLHDRMLDRLIAFSFASSLGPAYSFRDAFHDFADVYFTLATEEGFSSETAAREQTVDALAQAFDEAITSGQLAPFSVSTRLTAVMVLTSLGVLHRQVHEGALTSTEAADLLVTMFFEGLQTSPLSSH